MSESQSVSDSHSTPEHPDGGFEPDTYPPELTTWNQWMNWFWGDDGNKIPVTYNRDTYEKDRFRPTIRENWRDHEDALWWAKNRDVDGLTYVLDDSDPFLVIDGDDVRNPATREIHPGFVNCIERAQSYADVSVSGAGIHIILHEELPDEISKIDTNLPEHPDFPEASFEVYDHGQHITMSGDHLMRTPNEVRCNPELIDDIVAQYGPKATEPDGSTESDEESDTDDESAPVEAIEHGMGDKPDEWPPCYYAALKARERPPEGANKWDIDRFAAQLGLWTGFSIDEVVAHFGEYCPVGKWDEEITRSYLENLAPKVEKYEYPIGVTKLYNSGILTKPECPNCSIHGIGDSRRDKPDSRMPSLHSLRPEDRQEVSGSGIRAVSTALEHLHIASAAEVAKFTGYSPKQTYNALNNDDWRREFRSVKVGRTEYWYDSQIIHGGFRDERLSELPMTFSELVQALPGAHENVDTDAKKAFLDTLYQDGPMTAREVSDETDTSIRYVRKHLNEFVELGFLENCLKTGSTAKAYRVNTGLVD